MEFRSERELERSAIPFLREQCENYSWQVPLFNRVIDLVAIDKDGKILGIEFKLRDWKRAIKQALVNSNSFDFMYVCVPGGSYIDRLKEEAKEYGIGVMIYDPEIKTVKIELRAQEISRQWWPNVRYVKKYIQTRRGI